MATINYNDFINDNIAPYQANKIGVYNSEGKRVGYIPLGNLKKDFGTRLYRFGLLSDVHDYEGSTAEPSEDFQTALQLFNDKEDVEFTCICGDISQNGTESEFQMFHNDVNTKSADTSVYTTSGNHDCGSGSGKTINETLWQTYTGNGLVFEKSRILDNGKTDHFLFLGMSTWSLGSSGTPYSDSNITWLSNKLEEYKNDRCFVFTHLFFPERAGNLNDIYPSYNWLQGTQLTTLQGLCDKYVNTIWFSGHSHWKWYLQKYQDRANIYRSLKDNGQPNCGWCVHVPSCASPIDSNGTTRVEKPLESEGAIVDVYENYIDIRGIDLKNNLYLPIATYRLDTTLIEYLNYVMVTADNFTQKPSGNGSWGGDTHNNGTDINGNSTSNPSVSYDESTNTIAITFDNHSQKMLFEHDLLTSSITQEQIHFTVGELTFFHGDVEVTNDSRYVNIINNGIGFYLTDENYSINVPTEDGVYAAYPTKTGSVFNATTHYGIQFNCSNSKYYTAGTNAGLTNADLFPITIKMKDIQVAIK